MSKALVIYHSQQYGNTAQMAEAVAEGLRSSGLKVVMFNTNEDRLDLTLFPHYTCVAFGSPDYFSYIAGGLKTFMDDHYIELRKGTEGMKDKPYALFYTHGGGGKVKSVLMELFKSIGTLVGDPVGCQGKPTPEILEECRKLGEKLAAAVK